MTNQIQMLLAYTSVDFGNCEACHVQAGVLHVVDIMSGGEQTVTACPPTKKKKKAQLQIVGLRHLGMINLASLIACNARQFPNRREFLQIPVVMPLRSISRLRQLKS